MSVHDNIEILTINFEKISVTSVYKPPKQTFVFENPDTFDRSQLNVVIGDFNSHGTIWG